MNDTLLIHLTGKFYRICEELFGAMLCHFLVSSSQSYSLFTDAMLLELRPEEGFANVAVREFNGLKLSIGYHLDVKPNLRL